MNYMSQPVRSINVDASRRGNIDVWVHRDNGKFRHYRHHKRVGKKISMASVRRAQRAQLVLTQ